MFGFLGFIIFGLIVGVIAKLLVPGRDPGGFIITALLGMVGATVGAWLGQVMGLYETGQPAGLVMAIIGAVVLLLLYRAIFTTRGPRAV
jgi:uncharacterized membrane protein YeaQ/YmgE (transglycosylase-associated protein family)